MALNVKAFVKRQLTIHTLGFWIWIGLTCALATITLLLCLKIFFAGSILTKQAVESGQRVVLTISTGEVDGNVRHTQHAQLKSDIVKGTDTSALQTPIVSKEGLAPAPLATITEDSERGILPIAGADGTLPWKYYARPYDSKEKRPLVAIIITNLGLSKSLTADTLKLPHGITLSFSPYANDSKAWARQAREEGFESLVDLPMQPVDYPLSDPGPYGLLDNLSPEESSNRLHWVLSRFPGFVGTLAPADEKLTPNTAVMRPTLVELAARGILFLYLKTPQNASLADLAKSRKLYILGIDSVIDNVIAQTPIENQLQHLVDLAKTQGYAIGMAHSYPPTTDALLSWQATLAAQGVDLVPVSAIAKRLFP